MAKRKKIERLPTPKGRVVVHLEISNRRTIAFVPHPNERGRWLALHPCVATETCPECKAWPGEPCKDLRQPGNYMTSGGAGYGCHYQRKANYKNTWDTLEPMTFVKLIHADFGEPDD